MTEEKVLILGCGDIGQRLANCLDPKVYSVTGLRRNPPQDLTYLRYRQCDLNKASQLGDILQQNFSIIVVTMTPSEMNDAGYERAYVQTCANLVANLKAYQLKPRLLVFVSSSAVYAQKNGEWVDENSPTEPEGFSGKRLLEAEAIIRNSGFAHTVVRFSGIYGPGRNRLLEQVRHAKASASQHFTNRIHADDCARCLAHLIELRCADKKIDSVYLASDSLPVPMIDVVTWLAQQMGIEHYLSESATNERGNKRCRNQRLRDSGFVFRYPTYQDGYAELLGH